MLVLDVSGSMGYNIETYDYVAMNTSDGRDLLITSQTYYLEVKVSIKQCLILGGRGIGMSEIRKQVNTAKNIKFTKGKI